MSGSLRGSFSLPSLAESALDPLLALLLLFAAAYGFGIAPDGPYVILALLTFSLSFPGDIYLFAGPGEMVRKTLLNWLVIAAILLVLGYVTGYLGYFAPPVLVTWLLATPLALVAAHAAARVLLPRWMSSEGARRRAVIVGGNETALQLARTFGENSCLGVRVLGFFDDRSGERLPDLESLHILGEMHELAAFARGNAVDHIYIALPMVSQPRILQLLDELKDTTASVFFVPDLFVTDLIQGRVDNVGGIPVVAVCDHPKG
jgi:putative colanic acid biosynthesis UDP-glucose lipid carrier transferase